MLKKLVLVLITTVIFSPVLLGMSGDSLHSLCKHLGNKEAKNLFVGYVMGFMGTYYHAEDLINHFKKESKFGYSRSTLNPFSGTICIPESIEIDQLPIVVCNYFDANPKPRKQVASSYLMDLFMDMYPCPR